MKIRVDSQPDTVMNAKTPENEGKCMKTKALVACGGDFTVYMDDDGRIYATGNSHLQVNNKKFTFSHFQCTLMDLDWSNGFTLTVTTELTVWDPIKYFFRYGALKTV